MTKKFLKKRLGEDIPGNSVGDSSENPVIFIIGKEEEGKRRGVNKKKRDWEEKRKGSEKKKKKPI